jgi:hypothetical protein
MQTAVLEENLWKKSRFNRQGNNGVLFSIEENATDFYPFISSGKCLILAGREPDARVAKYEDG